MSLETSASTFGLNGLAGPSSAYRSYQNNPSSPNHYEGNDMGHYRQNSSRLFRGKTTRDIPAFEITQGDWLKLSAAAFREHTGDRPGAAKELAGELECSDKTTRSWLAAETAPSGILDLRAMARIPEYAALKRRLAAQESAMDPRVQETIQQLHAMTMQLAGEGA